MQGRVPNQIQHRITKIASPAMSPLKGGGQEWRGGAGEGTCSNYVSRISLDCGITRSSIRNWSKGREHSQLGVDLHGDVGTVLGAASRLGHADGGLARNEALGGDPQEGVAGPLHLLVKLGAWGTATLGRGRKGEGWGFGGGGARCRAAGTTRQPDALPQ